MPSKEQYWRNPEKYRTSTLDYAKQHTDWKRIANREWAAKKRSTPEGRAALNENEARYRQRLTPEEKTERAEYQRQWFAEHPTYSRDKQAEDHRLRPAKRMVESAKVRARSLGVPYDLDWKQIGVPELCPALGIKLEPGNGKLNGTSPALDRIVPELGYVMSNVRVISCSANAIKRDKTLEQLEEYVSDLKEQLRGAELVVAYVKRELINTKLREMNLPLFDRISR